MLGKYNSSHFTTITPDGKEIISGGASYGGRLLYKLAKWRNQRGAFVETIVDAAKDRLEAYQHTVANCSENQEAIELLTKALEVLNNRTKRRQSEGNEGYNVLIGYVL